MFWLMYYNAKNIGKDGDSMNFGNMRRSAKLTQEDVSSLLGISRTAISMWETGDAFPRTEMLPKIASLYNCTVDELLREHVIKTDNNL